MDAMRLTDQEAIEMTERYGAHNYHPLPVTIVRGEGIYVWDGSGKQYIDAIGSYSAVANGHLAPAVIEAAKRQLDKLTLTSRAVYTTELALFLKHVCEFTGTDMCCPMNTGAEVVETAIKLARKWAYTVKGVQHDRAEIIVAADNFHGRTTTIVGFSTERQYSEHFGPFAPGFAIVPFGSIDALRDAINPNTAAVLMEPIQAEGGILFPPDGFMADVRQLCTDENLLLIWDEIQTGFCRTGRKFAWQHEDAEPDLICLGKALGGGVLPVSAVAGRRDVLSVFKPGDHGSTFGGNPLACTVAMAAMDDMVDRDLAENSARMGERLMNALRGMQAKTSCIQEVRGRGLLVGLEISERQDTERLQQAFLEEGVLTKETRSRTFRFAPPLTITSDQVDELAGRIERALESIIPLHSA
jgi:ornithine--oxo-acid transaminase